MRLTYDRKPGYAWLAAVTVLFLATLLISREIWNHGITMDLIILVVVYLALATFLHFKYVHVAVRTDAQGLTIERAMLPKVQFRWNELQVEEREAKTRAAGGWMLTSKETGNVYFLPWKGLSREDAEQLRQALQEHR
ncbi:hypothetical protein [Tumebacillus flagellatus]|uniref:DUF5673 domain-containing protein n=1 Tax=Tumebacillus flagellatus TaxID=1157490 RepID=A0A074MHI5_9BACL|nr:hypothetical protein [Tumebacillus flagellatus]KEO85112.1 hypothetical protein EL26_00695 [Tumebacillus flagellatus]